MTDQKEQPDVEQEEADFGDQVPGVIATDSGIEPTGPSATVGEDGAELADDQSTTADLSVLDGVE
jgi:hypothetical protein